jgi:hypothetical protein
MACQLNASHLDPGFNGGRSCASLLDFDAAGDAAALVTDFPILDER